MGHEIQYGKADVKVYRTYAEPLAGVTRDPESPFSGRENTLIAAAIEVVVHGEAFLAGVHASATTGWSWRPTR